MTFTQVFRELRVFTPVDEADSRYTLLSHEIKKMENEFMSPVILEESF